LLTYRPIRRSIFMNPTALSDPTGQPEEPEPVSSLPTVDVDIPKKGSLAIPPLRTADTPACLDDLSSHDGHAVPIGSRARGGSVRSRREATLRRWNLYTCSAFKILTCGGICALGTIAGSSRGSQLVLCIH